jgi:hypothetical protein
VGNRKNVYKKWFKHKFLTQHFFKIWKLFILIINKNYISILKL